MEKEKKKKKTQTLESQFTSKLITCSKNNDLSAALSLYETALSQNVSFSHNHFDTLLYLCSNSLHHSSSIENGFSIFNHMLACNINPTEATITAVARLASAKGYVDFAFELVKTMNRYNLSPRLRTYDPVLFAFCRNLDADKAYLVEEDMVSMGIHAEESQLAALIKVSAEVGRGEKVYTYLHKLRCTVSWVNALTAEIIEGWFCSTFASDVGSLDWDESRIRDAILKNGGGWHGQGWLGKGEWIVCKSNISAEGCCSSCRKHLACVDIDWDETEKFAESIASLAMEKELKADFKVFQEWVDNHVKYEAIVDGANVGLYQQNFENGGFSISQLDAVVKALYERNGEKWPLIILSNKRVGPLMDNPSNRKKLKEWQDQGLLYTTPNGSNDDWYWLYAAVKQKCLLVSNDEMRDHIFELLGSSFFPKWKERHQVRYTFLKNKLRLLMPPSYSLVIQESKDGSWHVPIAAECSDELSRIWLCITRTRHQRHSNKVLNSFDAHAVVPPLDSNQMRLSSVYKAATVITAKGSDSIPTSFLLPTMNQWRPWKNRAPLVCINHYSNIEDWHYTRECQKFQDIFMSTGLHSFVDCAFKHIDRDLISAFVERWYPETSTFHLPWGEMTITSFDVINILGTTVGSNMYQWDEDITKHYKEHIVGLFGFDDESWNQIYKPSKGFTISLRAIRERFKNKCCDQSDKDRILHCVNAYCSYVIGNTIAASKDGNRMQMMMCVGVDFIKELGMDWTSGCLAYLYVELGKASRAKCVHIGGYLTVLQAWIYEHFPRFVEKRLLDENYTSTRPLALKYNTFKTTSNLSRLIEIRDALDSYPITSVIFDPYEKELPDWEYKRDALIFFNNCAFYMPERVSRQFGYIQRIPPEPVKYVKNMRPLRGSNTRKEYSANFQNRQIFNMKSHMSKKGKANPPYMVVANYLDWYYEVSHPIVNPPRFEGRNDHIWNFGVNKALNVLSDAITKHTGKRSTPKALLADAIKARDTLENIPLRRPYRLEPSESLRRAISIRETTMEEEEDL